MVKGSHGFYYSALRLMPASTVQDTRAASYGDRYRGVASERLVGSAARLYVPSRISVGPENPLHADSTNCASLLLRARADVEISRAETARPIGTEEEAGTVSR